MLSLSGLEGQGDVVCSGDFTFKHSDFIRRLFWNLSCEGVPPTAKSLELNVDGIQKWGKTLKKEDIAGERLVTNDELDTSALTVGRHNLEIRILDD